MTTRFAQVVILLITVAIVTLIMQSMPISAQDNATPMIVTPDSTPDNYLFPRGAVAKLEFPSAPATNPDNDDTITYDYHFVMTVPDTSTTDDATDTTDVSPAEALFTVTETDNTFEFKAVSNVTPKIFNDLYGAVISYDIPVKMYANEGNDDSTDFKLMEFTIKASYDASPQFHLAATYESDSRWTLDKEITVYEGDGVNEQLYKVLLGDYDNDNNPNSGQPTRINSPTDALHIPWTSSFSGSREWSMGNRDDTQAKPTLRCNDQNGEQSLIWDKAGSEDSYYFEADESPNYKRGHLTTRFINAPDYDIPGDANKDNIYNVRVVGTHRIHKLGTNDRTLGCETSAIDFKVTVKDVGPPAPIPEMNLTLEPNKGAAFKIDWDITKFNQFLDDGTRVDFPHSSFNVTRNTISHDPPGLRFPGGNTDTEIWFQSNLTGIEGITGTPGTTYTITITLTNSEGQSEPVSQTIQIPGPPDRPDAPTVTTAGPTSLEVSWTAPKTNGRPIDGYSLQTRKDGEQNWTYWNLGRNTATTTTITTLEPNTTYEVNLRAHAENEASYSSEPTTATTPSQLTKISTVPYLSSFRTVARPS